MFKLVDCQSFGSGVGTSTNIKTKKNCLSVFQGMPFLEKKKAAWCGCGVKDRLCLGTGDLFRAPLGAAAASAVLSGEAPTETVGSD